MTKIVGILNITPDSFSDEGEYLALERSKKACMLFIYEQLYVRVRDSAVHYTKRQEYKERRSSWYNNAYANTS